MKPASRRWTFDEKAGLDRLLDAGKKAAEIAVAIDRTRQAIYARMQRLYRKGAREARLLGMGLKAKPKGWGALVRPVFDSPTLGKVVFPGAGQSECPR
jgi:hypothetical protein